jgi:nucleoside-diphosphate-sugar epimerase
MGDLLEMACTVTGKSPRIETEDARVRPENSEVMELVCDASRARERLGWEDRVGLEEGVKRTAEWIAEHLDDYKPHLYNL